MRYFLAGLGLGFSLGFLGCWYYMLKNRLIRSREEWEKANKDAE